MSRFKNNTNALKFFGLQSRPIIIILFCVFSDFFDLVGFLTSSSSFHLEKSSILRGIEFFLRHFHKQVAGREEEEEEEEEERKPAAKNENNNAPNVSV